MRACPPRGRPGPSTQRSKMLGRALRLSLGMAFVALAALAAPRPARAGWTVAGSAGLGVEVSPEAQVQAGNLMGTVGYELLGMLRPELGVVGSLEAARHGRPTQGGLEFRPMLVVQPPLLPVYGRLIVSGVDLFSSSRRTVAYGGALGLQLGVLGVKVFGEAGVLPRAQDGRYHWILEARAGLLFNLT